MNIQINNEDRNPIYLQIVEQIGNLVLCGDLKAGDKLPSVRELSVELGINPNTVARAYRDLQYKEVINSRRTEGTFITDKLTELFSPEKKKTISGLQKVNVRENKFAVVAIRSEGHLYEDLNRHLVNNLQKKGIIPVSVHLDENKESLERGLDEVMSLKPNSIIIDGASGNNIMDYLEASQTPSIRRFS